MLHDCRKRLLADVTVKQELPGCLGDFATQDDGLSGWIIADKSVNLVPQLARHALQGACGGTYRRHSVQHLVLSDWYLLLDQFVRLLEKWCCGDKSFGLGPGLLRGFYHA